MKVFISWSGDTSRKVGEALRDWLPSVLQSVQPWMSDVGIDRGTVWFSELSKQLDEGAFGVLCLTPDSLGSEWIHFEAGALCKSMEKARVCPYLFGLETTSVRGPLTMFNMAVADEAGTRGLLESINGASERRLAREQIATTFEMWWPKLKDKLDAIRASGSPAPPPPRDLREMVEEILEVVRNQERLLTQRPTFRLPANPKFVKSLLYPGDQPTLGFMKSDPYTELRQGLLEYLTERDEDRLRKASDTGQPDDGVDGVPES